MIDHVQFRLRYRMTPVSELAFTETQKYNYMTAYGDLYQGCLVAGSIAQDKIDNLETKIQERDELINIILKQSMLRGFPTPKEWFSIVEKAKKLVGEK